MVAMSVGHLDTELLEVISQCASWLVIGCLNN
jgi:hypothetical protein